MRACHVLLPLLLFAATPIRAEPVLALEDVARLALEQQPSLDAYTKASAAANEAAIAEGQLPDPLLKFGVQNLPVTGEGALRRDREDMTMVTVGVMQEIVRKPVRIAAANRMLAQSAQWQAEGAIAARQVVRDAQLAWVDAFDAAKRAALFERLAGEIEAEREVAKRRIPSGTMAARELFELDATLAMTHDKRLVAAQAARKAQAQLSRWIGAAAFRPLPPELPAEHFSDTPPAPTDVLAAHPQIEALRKTEDVMRFEAERARAERRPNWSWELMYGQRQEGRADLATLQFSVPLLWNRADRQDRRLAEKLALAERARDLTLDGMRELNAEYAAVIAARDTAQARDREHVERLIPAARARLETARAGYAAGTLPLARVWEARRHVLEVEMEHWMIQADRLRAALRLAYLLGGQPS